MDLQINPRRLYSYRRVFRLLEKLRPTEQAWAYTSPASHAPQGNIMVFSGSFNPPTIAHVALLRQARRFARHQGGHWQIYAAMSKQSVDKETLERMTLLDRVILLEEVLKNEVKDTGLLLLNRGLYVEQAQGIRAAFPGARRLAFLLGFDKIVQILDPRYYSDRNASLHKLFQLADLLVAPRGQHAENELRQLLAQSENLSFAHFIHPLPLVMKYRDISSTQARQHPEEPSTMLPDTVRDFITRTRPYMPPANGTDQAIPDLYAERTRALQKLLNG